MASTGSKQDPQPFMKKWGWELASILISIVLITGFWLFWVYVMGEESPMAPSSMVFLFYALLKVSVFNGLSLLLTFVTTRDNDDDQYTWKTWAVFMVAFSLSSLA